MSETDILDIPIKRSGVGDGPPRHRRRRSRIKFTEEQLNQLEIFYESNRYPDINVREDIADCIDISEARIQVWFQNRRARQRRQQKCSSNYTKNNSNKRDEPEHQLESPLPTEIVTSTSPTSTTSSTPTHIVSLPSTAIRSDGCNDTKANSNKNGAPITALVMSKCPKYEQVSPLPVGFVTSNSPKTTKPSTPSSIVSLSSSKERNDTSIFSSKEEPNTEYSVKSTCQKREGASPFSDEIVTSTLPKSSTPTPMVSLPSTTTRSTPGGRNLSTTAAGNKYYHLPMYSSANVFGGVPGIPFSSYPFHPYYQCPRRVLTPSPYIYIPSIPSYLSPQQVDATKQPLRQQWYNMTTHFV
ncbi:homeobox protein ceh-37-like [Anneissia japonica]|uniref:homeobox protein ceh-37-like n=1 Tax=Anneissia japonica TaxID=1529436 RepID=UPI0014258A9E|nr:homeobox protein ceh-37-like [Anneissia japonica]